MQAAPGFVQRAGLCAEKFTPTRRLLDKSGLQRSADPLNPEPVWDEAILQSSRDELVKLVAGRDAVVMIIPSRRLWQGDKMTTATRIHEAFVGLVRETGLKVCDMKPVLEAGGAPLSYYFETDPRIGPRTDAPPSRGNCSRPFVAHR